MMSRWFPIRVDAISVSITLTFPSCIVNSVFLLAHAQFTQVKPLCNLPNSNSALRACKHIVTTDVPKMARRMVHEKQHHWKRFSHENIRVDRMKEFPTLPAHSRLSKTANVYNSLQCPKTLCKTDFCIKDYVIHCQKYTMCLHDKNTCLCSKLLRVQILVHAQLITSWMKFWRLLRSTFCTYICDAMTKCCTMRAFAHLYLSTCLKEMPHETGSNLQGGI